MKDKILWIALFGILLGFAAPRAMAAPSAWYSFNDLVFNIPGEQWILDQEGDWVCDFRNQTADFLISGNIEVVGDPQIIYGITASNFTSSSATFAFNFYDLGFAPVVGQTKVYGAAGGHVTDGTGDGIDLTRVNSHVQISDLMPTPMGVNALASDFHHVGEFPGAVYDIGTDIEGPRNGPFGTFTDMHVQTAFNLSGNDDVAVLTGSAILFPRPVPEPATALLLVPGLLGLVAWKSRKRS